MHTILFDGLGIVDKSFGVFPLRRAGHCGLVFWWHSFDGLDTWDAMLYDDDTNGCRSACYTWHTRGHLNVAITVPDLIPASQFFFLFCLWCGRVDCQFFHGILYRYPTTLVTFTAVSKQPVPPQPTVGVPSPPAPCVVICSLGGCSHRLSMQVSTASLRRTPNEAAPGACQRTHSQRCSRDSLGWGPARPCRRNEVNTRTLQMNASCEGSAPALAAWNCKPAARAN